MSNNGDLKKEGPPTLFNSQSEADEAAHTRILASLEGKVSANGKAPRKAGPRYAIGAAVAVLAVGIGSWIMLNPSDEPAPAQVAEHAAPVVPKAAQPASAAVVAPVVAAAPASAPAVAPAATIVNVEPTDEHALDKLGKAPPPEKAVAKAPADAVHSETSTEHAATVKSTNTAANTAQGKAETAKLVAKSTGLPVKDTQNTKAKPQAVAKSARHRKGGLTADDPDADLLAALLSPHTNNAKKPADQPNYKGQ